MAYKSASLHEYARCLKGNNKCGRWTCDNIQFSCWTDRILGSDSDILDAMGLNPSSWGRGCFGEVQKFCDISDP